MKSTRKLKPHVRNVGAIDNLRSNDPGRPRYQHPPFSVTDAWRLPGAGISLCLTDPDVQLCLSADIYTEYEEVIRRPKFKRTDGEIQSILRALREAAVWVRPSESIQVCPDPDDDVFLECSQAADAHYLITGNIRHFPADWGRTQVLTARKLIELNV